jgi:serine phosphatase RsbU (regulator of sigma subunit)
MNNHLVHVLLVEDNPADARLIDVLLRQSGTGRFALSTVDTLAGALAHVQAKPTDIVLLDMTLPDTTGLQTTQRAVAAMDKIPIIMLTGMDDEDLAIRAVQQGAQDYLIKGQVDDRILARAIHYAIERKKIQDQVSNYANQLEAKNLQMAAELDMAREFQLAFLPRKYPRFPRGANRDHSALRFHVLYEPSGAVGGDYFEILPLSDTVAGVFLCDVMGHGVRSALVTAMIRGLVAEHRDEGADPGRFLTHINSSLASVLRQSDITMFASALYMTIDLVKGRIRCANAGHPIPLRVSQHLQRVDPLPITHGTSGPVLGLFDTSAYPVIETTVESSDLIVLYTDGLYEVANADGEEYGRDRLQAALQKRFDLFADQLFPALLKEIRAFSASHTFTDDVCLLGVEIAKLLPSTTESHDLSGISG